MTGTWGGGPVTGGEGCGHGDGSRGEGGVVLGYRPAGASKKRAS